METKQHTIDWQLGQVSDQEGNEWWKPNIPKSVWCSEKLIGKLIIPCTCVKKSEKPQTNNYVALEDLGKF